MVKIGGGRKSAANSRIGSGAKIHGKATHRIDGR